MCKDCSFFLMNALKLWFKHGYFPRNFPDKMQKLRRALLLNHSAMAQILYWRRTKRRNHTSSIAQACVRIRWSAAGVKTRNICNLWNLTKQSKNTGETCVCVHDFSRRPNYSATLRTAQRTKPLYIRRLEAHWSIIRVQASPSSQKAWLPIRPTRENGGRLVRSEWWFSKRCWDWSPCLSAKRWLFTL